MLIPPLRQILPKSIQQREFASIGLRHYLTFAPAAPQKNFTAAIQLQFPCVLGIQASCTK